MLFASLACLLVILNINHRQTDPASKIRFLSSTPGDLPIKRALGISRNAKIDFIRWDLIFLDDDDYQLAVIYGVGKPNTLDFEGGGTEAKFAGKFEKRNNNGKTIYTLEGLPEKLSLVQLNSNLLHVLTSNNHLMIGNGGWSYTINRQNPVADNGTAAFTGSSLDSQYTVVFEGRTPCKEVSREYNIGAPGDCIKLKWLLTLHRDKETMRPSTYTLKRTLHRSKDITGKWKLVPASENGSRGILQLEPDSGEKPISLGIGDQNVLFFLTTEGKMMTGNRDFSYTLNRRN